MLLGNAAAIIRPEMKKSPELKAMYHNIHFIRDDMKKNWLKLKDQALEDISREVRKSYEWAA